MCPYCCGMFRFRRRRSLSGSGRKLFLKFSTCKIKNSVSWHGVGNGHNPWITKLDWPVSSAAGGMAHEWDGSKSNALFFQMKMQASSLKQRIVPHEDVATFCSITLLHSWLTIQIQRTIQEPHSTQHKGDVVPLTDWIIPHHHTKYKWNSTNHHPRHQIGEEHKNPWKRSEGWEGEGVGCTIGALIIVAALVITSN